MDSSILDTIKKLLGINPDFDDVFDTDIILYINMAISTLNQIGVDKNGYFAITGTNETWEDYLDDQNDILALVQNYIHLKVKSVFDPPQNSILAEAYSKQLSELEFRIHVAVDPRKEVETDGN